MPAFSERIGIPPHDYRPGHSETGVLFSHGLSVDRNEYLDFFHFLATKMNDLGFHTLQIDYCGHGDNKYPLNIALQLLEALRAVDFLKARGCKRLIFVGCSFGAGPMTFAMNRAEVPARGILICPVLNYSRQLLSGETEWAQQEFSPSAVQESIFHQYHVLAEGFRIPSEVITEMQIVKLDAEFTRCADSLLIIAGESDSVLSIETMRALSCELRLTNLIVVEKMDHGYTQIGDELGQSTASLRNRDRILDEIVKWGA